ncbi:hypothetical protein BDZ88DRAFT_453997 [Geranomyces variabilis]|nr:hypothetical protein BDZ88DRAFT_453997 [Geranomyces variabilis]KAJ3143728.1 hypothetical protein HDU90_000493 [Geranomyces variabilis]
MESRTKRAREENSDERSARVRKVAVSSVHSLCQTLDGLLPSLATPGPQITAACEVLNHLHELLREAAGRRVAEGSLEAAAQSADLLLVAATADHLIRLPSVRVQAGALRVISAIVKPSDVKLRNWALARWDAGLCLRPMLNRLIEFACSPELQVQFYTLKILATVCKTAAAQVAPLVSASTVTSLADIVNGYDPACPMPEEGSSHPHVPLLAITFLRRLLETPGSPSHFPAEGIIGAALVRTITSSVSSRGDNDVALKYSDSKILAQAIPVLYILNKISPATNPFSGTTVTALSKILSIVSATGSPFPDALDIARYTCATMLSALKQKELPQLPGIYPQMMQSLAEYAHLLSESRPSIFLIVSLLDTLSLCLPRSTDTALTARRANISLALLKIWRTMHSEFYVDKYAPADLVHAQSSLLKVITFVLGDLTGLDVYMQAPADILSLFHENVSELVGRHLNGETSRLRNNMVPGIGLRSLRLISVLVSDSRCRRSLVENNLLPALISPDYGHNILSGTAEDTRTTFTMLFRVLRRLAEDSGIRFMLRDGRLWSQASADPDELSETAYPQPVASARTSDFTIVHFCVRLFLTAMVEPHSPDGSSFRNDIIQESLIFLWENFRNDAIVANAICRFPLSLLVSCTNRMPAAWLQQPQGMVSVCPALVELITARSVNSELDLDFEIDGQIATNASRLAAAGLLNMLISVKNGQSQLLAPRTLSTLSESLCVSDGSVLHVNRILVGVLGRLIGNPELLQTMIGNLGFSAIFEPVLCKEARQQGDGAQILKTFSAALSDKELHPGTMVARLFSFFSASPSNRSAASAVMREKLAIAMAYCDPAKLCSGVLAIPHDPLQKAFVDELFSLATSDRSNAFHAVMAFRYIHWTSCPVFDAFVHSPATPPSATILDLFDNKLDAHSLLGALDQSDTVRFSFPDEPDAQVLLCPRAPLVESSAVLRAMFSWNDRTGRPTREEIEIHDVDRATWLMFASYLDAMSEGKARVPRQKAVGSSESQIWSLVQIRRIARLAECADRFLCENLLIDCLHFLHSVALESFHRKDGTGLFLRDFCASWQCRPVGRSITDLVTRIARLASVKAIGEIAQGSNTV